MHFDGEAQDSGEGGEDGIVRPRTGGSHETEVRREPDRNASPRKKDVGSAADPGNAHAGDVVHPALEAGRVDAKPRNRLPAQGLHRCRDTPAGEHLAHRIEEAVATAKSLPFDKVRETQGRVTRGERLVLPRLDGKS